MAKQAILAAFVSLNATDISAYCKSCQLSIEADNLDSTNFGSGGWQENLAGIRSSKLEITVLDDVAASAVDSILWPLFATVVAFEVRLNSSARSTSNPSYTGNVLIAQHSLGGDVGDLATIDLSFPTSGAVTRLTS